MNASNPQLLFPDAPTLLRFQDAFRDRIGSRVDYRLEVGSTQDVVREAAERGEPHGFVCVAESQTSGRGRRGRAWEASPYSSLLFSILLRDVPGRAAGWIGLTAASATARALRQTAAVEARVKWPNDVVATGACGVYLPGQDSADPDVSGRDRNGPGNGREPGGAGTGSTAAASAHLKHAPGTTRRTPRLGTGIRKIAGVLVETAWSGGEIRHVILGIGINVLQPADRLPARARVPATSILIETGHEINRLGLLRETLCLLDASLGALRSGGATWEVERARIRREMDSWWGGARFEVAAPGGEAFRGEYASLADSGALILRVGESGTICISEAEEVNLCDT
ncbi:MAG: biotin--[acetyl-CoA-carboxylase] ligase family protein [Planctomycetota bacterium]|nr:biotin--[acetyl-CoA-carboxylase] ligase family protein [Planctomycetota bacterium]